MDRQAVLLALCLDQKSPLVAPTRPISTADNYLDCKFAIGIYSSRDSVRSGIASVVLSLDIF